MTRKGREKYVDPNAQIGTCDLCHMQFQNGPHIYGQHISAWKMLLCRPCYDMNGDGFVDEQKIVSHLKLNGIDTNILKKNANGFIVRP